jgi:hypothetical protein
VYKSQGVEIHDKHIEMIVRQMLRRVLIVSPNDSDFLPAALIDEQLFKDVNRELVGAGKKPAEGRPQLMGITKASLATDSWLSAASFQETTRVLTDASHPVTVRLHARPEGERHHRQADPGRHRSPAVPGSPAFTAGCRPLWRAWEVEPPDSGESCGEWRQSRKVGRPSSRSLTWGFLSRNFRVPGGRRREGSPIAPPSRPEFQS